VSGGKRAARAAGASRPDAGGWFAGRYGREPEGVCFAPGRVNLLGGPGRSAGR